jgi:hypothetical protein
MTDLGDRERRSADGVIRPGAIDDLGERRSVYRRAAEGRLTRLAPGVFVPTQELEQLSPEALHGRRIEAVWPRARDDEVLSHRSAAAWWGLPIYGPRPERPETVLSALARRSSSATFQRHSTSRPLTVELVRGIPVTSLARTVVDVAASSSFESGVVVADAAWRLSNERAAADPRVELDAEAIEHELRALEGGRGADRARQVIAFANGKAQLPGESVSRCSMLRIGCPIPELQHRIVGQSGLVYFLDFWWPGQRIAAEFDGASKYREARYRRGRSPEQVVLDEKSREDEIRLEVDGFGRWGFPIAQDPRALGERLHRIGVRW